MISEIPDNEFEGLWRRLQRVGLNAYEARAYLVLVGHPRFKALELAARARVPRQKIYEVLDSLVEKGFAQVLQERTKLFSAVEPGLAIPAFVARRRQEFERELTEQTRLADGFVEDLSRAFSRGQGGRGTLDFLRIVNEPAQTAAQYRRMLAEVRSEYVEFSREPYAVDPLDEQLVKEARQRGVSCRLLLESVPRSRTQQERLDEYSHLGVEIRLADSLPMKLAVFDNRRGLIALLDPVITKPTWTAVLFEHEGFAEAMKGLFDDYWNRARAVLPAPQVEASLT